MGSVVASRIAEKGKTAQAVSLMFAGLTVANIIGVSTRHFYRDIISLGAFSFAIVVLVGLITLWSLKSMASSLGSK